MSSDYYGSIAGEIADQGSGAEAGFLEWLNEYARREAEPGRTPYDEMRAAFMAGRANLDTAPAKRAFYVVRVSAEGRADPECGPCGPYTAEEAVAHAHREPDPLSGWRDLIVTEWTHPSLETL